MTHGDRLVELVERETIVDLTVRYAWALDTRQWADLDDVFVPDATARLPGFLGSREAIKDRVRRVLEPLDASQHLVSNHQVIFEGERATCRCSLQAQHVRTLSTGSANYLVGGSYFDQLVRTEQGWRIAHRELVIIWTEGDPAVVRGE